MIEAMVTIIIVVSIAALSYLTIFVDKLLFGWSLVAYVFIVLLVGAAIIVASVREPNKE